MSGIFGPSIATPPLDRQPELPPPPVLTGTPLDSCLLGAGYTAYLGKHDQNDKPDRQRNDDEDCDIHIYLQQR